MCGCLTVIHKMFVSNGLCVGVHVYMCWVNVSVYIIACILVMYLGYQVSYPLIKIVLFCKNSRRYYSYIMVIIPVLFVFSAFIIVTVNMVIIIILL